MGGVTQETYDELSRLQRAREASAQPTNAWLVDGAARRGVIMPWRMRSQGALMIGMSGDHKMPADGVDATRQPWLGASRVIDAPARRRAQRKSWNKLKKESR